MTAPVVVPERPVLVTIPAVELIHAGSWNISTGPWNVTSADLYAAAAATDCPAVRNPVLKLGHTDPRFDGEPAIGWVSNLAVSANGVQLVGDYNGLPAWLGDVMASAYPDRSIEGEYDHRCQIGHTHPFVLTAVALLGVTAPGVGTLQSLQDVAALYGIAAATDPAADPFRITVTAKGTPMAQDLKVAASATVEDVRRSFYEGPAASNWWWIEDLFLDPLEVVAIDDDSGLLWRLPFTVAADGQVTWGDAQQVKREYVAASATARKPLASWSSRAESRPQTPGDEPGAPPPPPAASAGGSASPQEDDTMSTLNEGLRQRLGYAEDADEATILSALDQALAERADPSPSPALPEGIVPIDAAQLEELKVAAAAGRAARDQQLTERREALVSAAVRDGRIAPVRAAHWVKQLEADPGSETVLASLEKGLVPLAEKGQDNPQLTPGQDLSWFGTPASTSQEG